MQQYAFVPEGFDTEANLDVLLFVPMTAETWSADQEGAGFVCIDRATGEFYNFLPFGTTELPAFNEDDIAGMKLAQADMKLVFPDYK